jgi:2-succinyl-6-hydroxy-2,4-cyclohexadiene-1-carboxylate synthase
MTRQQNPLWFETHGPDGRQIGPDSPAVVLLHGFTGSHLTWEELCAALVDDYFIMTPDLPGHGHSQNVLNMNVDGHTNAVLDLMERQGVEKVALLGYSMGGRIALKFALKYPEKLSCLILESTSPGIRDPKEREERKKKDEELARGIRRNGLPWFVERWESQDLFASQKSLDPILRQKIRNERLANSTEGLASSLESAGAGTMHPLWSQLSGLRMPVLVIAGQNDPKYLLIAKELEGQLSNCTLRIIRDAGHAAHLENPGEFCDIVKRFLYQVYSEEKIEGIVK